MQEPGDIAANTVRAGIFSCLFMGVIYLFVTIVGTQSRGLFAAAENGGTALAQIAQHYLGYPGLVILDEATSRLDPATETRIERAIDKLLAGRTACRIALGVADQTPSCFMIAASASRIAFTR